MGVQGLHTNDGCPNFAYDGEMMYKADHSDREGLARQAGQFRERFRIPVAGGGQDSIYLCSNSLGLQSKDAVEAVMAELERWGQMGVNGHFDGPMPWVPYHQHTVDGLAMLTGAKAHEVVAMNSLTVNLHLMLTSFFQPHSSKRKIVVESGAFPTDRHAVDSQLASRGLDPQRDVIELKARADRLHHEEDLEQLLEQHGDDIALVLWPGVQYSTGQAFDIARIARACQRADVVLGLDLAHAIGNIELNLHEDGPDFAVWCSYKYLCSGPGAVGGCFVHDRHKNFNGPRLTGWWGHEESTRFLMAPEHGATRGVQGWQLSGPPILSTAPLLASLSLYAEAGWPALHRQALALTNHLASGIQKRLAEHIEIITPLEPHRHGAQLSLRASSGRAAGRRWFERLQAHGVVGDWREPDIIRIAPSPLYNTLADVEAFLDLAERLA